MRKDKTRLAGSRKQKRKGLEGNSLYAEKKQAIKQASQG